MSSNEHLTDADLGLFATNLAIPMTRDATEFAAKRAFYCFETIQFFDREE